MCWTMARHWHSSLWQEVKKTLVSWNNSKGKQSTGTTTLNDVLVHWASLPRDHDKAQRYVLDCLKMQQDAICGQALLSVYLLMKESAPVSKGQTSGVGDSGGQWYRFSIVHHLMLQPMLFYSKCIKIFIKHVKKLAGMKSHLKLSHQILLCCTLKCVGLCTELMASIFEIWLAGMPAHRDPAWRIQVVPLHMQSNQ